MKKILNSILASSLILSMGTITFATELPQTFGNTEVLQEIERETLSSMSPEVASAYVGVIENITQKYGVEAGNPIAYNGTGIIVARLIDFNQDGIMELYIAYATKADDGTVEAYPVFDVVEEVWAYSGSSAVKVHSNVVNYEGGNYARSDGSFLLNHDGQILLVHDYARATNNIAVIECNVYQYKNAAFSIFETLELKSDPYEQVTTYNIDGKTTSLEEGKSHYELTNVDLLAQSTKQYSLNTISELFYVFDWSYQNCLPQLQAIASQPSSKTATPSTAKVMVNGELVNFGAYNIDGFNFYKLTDMSSALNGTGKQFEVTWDGEIGAINMKIGSPHIVLGSELQGTSGTDKIAEEMDVKVLKNSALVDDLIVYSIDGSSYFQLDKLKGVLGIDVGWDGATSTITITT